MRPAMLLPAVVLWLKWEGPIYLFLSPRQWPFFCVQMLQCVDNIPVGFGGGLSQCWWHFDPPVLNSPLESPFACAAALLRNLCVIPQTAAAALESLIPSPSHCRNPHLFLCVFSLIGDTATKETSGSFSTSVLSSPRQTSSALALFCAPVWTPRWIIVLRPSESLGRVSGGRH